MTTLIKWDINEYHKMIATGLLDNKKCELLNGEIITMSPELPIHYNTAKRGVNYLKQLLTNKADVRFNGPVTLANSEPEPDIAIVKLPESKYDRTHPYPEDIYWLIEVANSSLSKDLTIKKQVYAQAKIPEYWVLNLQQQELIVFRQPEANNYVIETIWAGAIVQSLAFPQIDIIVNNLFNL